MSNASGPHDTRVITWRKSSHSVDAQGDCVELAAVGDDVWIRDSKNLDLSSLILNSGAWRRFSARIKSNPERRP